MFDIIFFLFKWIFYLLILNTIYRLYYQYYRYFYYKTQGVFIPQGFVPYFGHVLTLLKIRSQSPKGGVGPVSVLSLSSIEQ